MAQFGEPHYAPLQQPRFDKREKDQAPTAADNFKVSDEGCECNKDDPVVCCLGMIAPCCLLGATRGIIDTDFTKEYSPWQGCNCTCIGFMITNILLEPCTLIGVPVPCLFGYFAVHEPLHSDNQPLGFCQDFWGYCLCFPCATCTDYNIARKKVRRH